MAFPRTTALEFLRRAYEQNRLAHAYLITGPPGSGKEMLAAEVASLVNGTPAKEVFSAKAREIFVAGPELKSRRISIQQIRELAISFSNPFVKFGGLLFHSVSFAPSVLHPRLRSGGIDAEHESNIGEAIAHSECI